MSRSCSGLRLPWTAHLLHHAQRQGTVRPAGCRAKRRTVKSMAGQASGTGEAGLVPCA